MAVAPDTLRSVRDHVSETEWQARVDLAACYRLCALYGWVDFIFTHISARVPGTDDYLINPFGLLFEEVTASSLVKLDRSGRVLADATGLGYNPGGFVIHGAVHEAREDAHWVMHLHTEAGVAVSCQRELLPLNQEALSLLPDLAYHDFEGFALDVAERERLVANLGDRNHLVLRNHGLLTLGRTPGAVFSRMRSLQNACAVQVLALAGGRDFVVPPSVASRDNVMQQVAQQRGPQGRSRTFDLAWNALRRKLDRLDPTYAA